MRIGILIHTFEALENWEWLLIERIRACTGLTLSLVVIIDRSNIDDRKDASVNWLFRMQARLESRMYPSNIAMDSEETERYLESIPQVVIRPESQKGVNTVSAVDRTAIGAFQLDVLLQHALGPVDRELAAVPKFGIWSLAHALDPRGTTGLWENIRGEKVVGARLLQQTGDPGAIKVIDEAFYNIHWSFYKNKRLVEEESIDLLCKNLTLLEGGRVGIHGSGSHYQPERLPGVLDMLHYQWKFFNRFSGRMSREILHRLLGVRYTCWTLFLGDGDFMETDPTSLQPIALPKGAFWADPFLFRHNGARYVFFENYSYQDKKGKISCGRLEQGKITSVADVLDLEYHLSYPFVFEEEGEIYMIPETGENRRVDIYRCREFPLQWELHASAFEGESIVDTTYFRDENGQRWLFLNKGLADFCNNLYIYQIDSLKLENIRPHRQNPVIIDTRVARNGGAIFRYNGQWIRPSQNNAHGIYGYGLKLNAIQKINLEEYQEETLVSIEPDFHKGIEATHHLHQLEDMFVIDGSYSWKF